MRSRGRGQDGRVVTVLTKRKPVKPTHLPAHHRPPVVKHWLSLKEALH